MPDGSTHKFGQITVVEHSDVVDRLAMTKNGQLLYRMLPVHADAFDLLAELTKYLDGNATCHGKPVTPSALHQVMRGIIRQLQLDGWKARDDVEEAIAQTPNMPPEMAKLQDSIREPHQCGRNQATPHGAKRSPQPSPGDVEKQLQTMSEADRLAALAATGVPMTSMPPASFTSPPRKTFASLPGAFSSGRAQPSLCRPVVR